MNDLKTKKFRDRHAPKAQPKAEPPAPEQPKAEAAAPPEPTPAEPDKP